MDRLLGVESIRRSREQNWRWTLTRARGYLLVCRPCDYTSGNLNKTSVERKVWRCLSANRLTVSELFHDILLISNVRRDYAGLWIALSVLRKGVIVWFPDCVDRQNSEMWSRGWAVAPKYSAPTINAFLQCLSSLIVPWKTNSRLWKIGSRFSFSGLALGFEP